MKKHLIQLVLAMTLSLASAVTAFAAWEQKGDKWYSYNEQGELQKSTWVGNYYVGADGAMMVNTLAPGGYWLDERGLATEEKRIYGDCILDPESYQTVGNQILIRGNIGDTGYASQAYIDSLNVGDVIAMPGDAYGVMCEFNDTDEVTEIYSQNGKKSISVSHILENPDNPWDEFKSEYRFSSQGMISSETGSCEAPIYRLIQKDVLLIVDKNTVFIPNNMMQPYGPKTIEEFLKTGQRNVLAVEISDGHLEQAEDIDNNYVG